MSDLITFSLDDLKKKIQENTQASFGNLIPAEMFAKLTEDAINKYFYKPMDYEYKGSSSYGHVTSNVKYSLTPFEKEVWEVLTPLVKEKVDAWFKDYREKDADVGKAIVDVLNGDTSIIDKYAVVMAMAKTKDAKQQAVFNMANAIGQALMLNGFTHDPVKISNDIIGLVPVAL